MDLVQVISAMRSRMPWPVARSILANRGLKPSTGWESTIERIEEIDVDPEITSNLENDFLEHILCGEKSVRLYEVKEADILELRAILAKISPDNHIVSKNFPKILSKDILAGEKPSGPHLVAVGARDGGIAVVFSSIVYFEIRENITAANFSEDVAEQLRDYSEIFGVKKERRQTFDIVWIPNSGNILEIRVDAPVNIPADLNVGMHTVLFGKVNSIFGRSFLPNARNVFPLIEKLYKYETEGKVVEIGFHTAGGADNHGRMRRRDICLREEPFHRGGSEAIGNALDPYKIAVRWEVKITDARTIHPEVFINGNSRLLHDNEAYFSDILFRGCAGEFEYAYVYDKIIPALIKNDANVAA